MTTGLEDEDRTVVPSWRQRLTRAWRANVFPITLDPHGSQLSDIIRALPSLRPLDNGMSTIINGEETNFSVCALNWLTDLVSGNAVAGIKGMKAQCYYQCFHASGSERSNLNYDIMPLNKGPS